MPAVTANTANPFRSFFEALTRKKPLDCRTDTQLKRCLNLVDLTALGVGSTLGLGLYVLAGQVAANKAGPAVIVSFAIAALASAFSALCYAEFAGRVPKAGSAYAYSYITVGEFVAFIIGWNMILEYVIGAASVARGFSGYILFVFKADHHFSLLDNTTTTIVSKANISMLLLNQTSGGSSDRQILPHIVPEDWWTFQRLFVNFDWLTIVIIFVITCFILYGVKESTNFTLLFTGVNLMVVLVAAFSGLSHINFKYWHLSKSDLPSNANINAGNGGFMPFGWSGVVAGSATCFFGFIGFDTIASSAEEAKNPKRNVPIAIILSLFISFLAYITTAAIQTLIWPYYDQNKIAVLPYIFQRLDMPWSYWILLIGGMAGLVSSQCGSIYPLPRIMYSMARDSIIYHYLAKINTHLQIPVRATIVGSIFIALLACLLEIEELADMVSIGTLAAYSLVSLSVLILRYENRHFIDDSTMVKNHISYPDITKTKDLILSPNITTTSMGGDNKQQSKQLMNDGADINESVQLEMQQNYANNITSMQQLVANNINNITNDDKNQAAATDDSNNNNIKLDKFDNNLDSTRENNDNYGNKHESLSQQQSTPIRIKGSRPILGYSESCESNNTTITNDGSTTTATTMSSSSNVDNTYLSKSKDLPKKNLGPIVPNDESFDCAKKLITLSIIVIIMLDIIIHLCINSLIPFNLLAQITIGTLTTILAILILLLTRLPTSERQDTFQVPLVPLIPFMSILVNTFLMLNLSYLTWLRFAIWMTIGFFIYFTYGIWHSTGYTIDLN